MMTFVSGSFSTMSWQAWMPLRPGNRMSITTTSGLWRRAFCSASRAVAASSTTVKSG